MISYALRGWASHSRPARAHQGEWGGCIRELRFGRFRKERHLTPGQQGETNMPRQEPAFSRRDFVKGGGALLGGLATARAGAEEPTRSKVPDTVLGRTGARVSRLGIGCAYFQRKQVTPDDVRA